MLTHKNVCSQSSQMGGLLTVLLGEVPEVLPPPHTPSLLFSFFSPPFPLLTPTFSFTSGPPAPSPRCAAAPLRRHSPPAGSGSVETEVCPMAPPGRVPPSRRPPGAQPPPPLLPGGRGAPRRGRAARRLPGGGCGPAAARHAAGSRSESAGGRGRRAQPRSRPSAPPRPRPAARPLLGSGTEPSRVGKGAAPCCAWRVARKDLLVNSWVGEEVERSCTARRR